jgi:hypothetical protein
MIELDTLAARLDARLAELYDREAEWEHETRNPAYDLATKAERELETVRALQEERFSESGNGSSTCKGIGNKARVWASTGQCEPAPQTAPLDPPRPGAFPMSPPDSNVAAERRALAARLLALADRLEADPAAAQEPLAREAYRLRRLHQEVVAGLADRRLAEVPAAASPTRRWCG